MDRECRENSEHLPSDLPDLGRSTLFRIDRGKIERGQGDIQMHIALREAIFDLKKGGGGTVEMTLGLVKKTFEPSEAKDVELITEFKVGWPELEKELLGTFELTELVQVEHEVVLGGQEAARVAVAVYGPEALFDNLNGLLGITGLAEHVALVDQHATDKMSLAEAAVD